MAAATPTSPLTDATPTSPFTGSVQVILDGYTRALVPQKRLVHRHTPDPTVLPLNGPQEHIWVLPEGQGFFHDLPAGPVMVRKEYDNILVAILSSLQRRQAIRPDTPNLGLVMANRLIMTPRDPTLFDALEYPNPFALPEYRNLHRERAAIIITGVPGIGKTCFLALLFHLRVAANLPTLYMTQPYSARIYKNGQFGLLTFTEGSIDVAMNLPPETWCLVDSNAQLETVPYGIQGSGRFIIHAASPRVGRMRYSTKLKSQMCLMTPWTLEELIIGSSLQDEHPSEANIQAFHETFGGSARDAYEHANELEAFESLVDATANRFSATDIEHIITTPNLELEIPGNIGHALLSAFPLGDGDRRQYQIKPPTDAMCLKVLNRLSASLDTARRHLYQICSGTSTPGCKVWAGQLFDQHYHDFLLLGGMWDLHTLQKPAGVTGNITWKPDQQPSGLSLLVHKGMMIVNGTQGAPPQLQPVPHVQFEQNNEPTTLTKGVYYRPTQRSSTTFDSFYVLNARHIIAFRAPRATTLDIKKEDVEWLATRKIKKITYVYVTPYKYDGPAHVEVPVELENSFDALYHIRLL
ncbi:hypothetical protein B0H15DRAFT_1016631 [Mycena belliarum]|uniref:Uncharacterized protein n=1 Tax=Mycena belliarum TaxID=1033014 RepID=A0AAD6XUV8_9AGAR|nr:hypothetical protein B0H15DRAFT_1016631 [Mycena belliae]